MFCPNCGSNCADGTKFCGKCGSPLPAPQPTPVAYNPQPVSHMPPPPPGTSYDYGYTPNPTPSAGPRIDKPMAWHNFLVGFLLWATAICAFISIGFMVHTFMGSYSVVLEAVYDYYPDFRTMQYVYMVLLAAQAILAIVAWTTLRGYKRSGITCLHLMYVCAIAACAVGSFGYASILLPEGRTIVDTIEYLIESFGEMMEYIGEVNRYSLGLASTQLYSGIYIIVQMILCFFTVFTNLLTLLLNVLYYSKRRHLFQ